MKLLLITLLLGGCATQSLEERALQCNEPTDECAKLHYNLERRLEREKRDWNCPPGFIKVGDRHNKGCMSRDDFERWKRWNLPM